jgi:hypothetical protein
LQLVPQDPQLSASLRRFTQVPPQLVRPTGQAPPPPPPPPVQAPSRQVAPAAQALLQAPQ